MTKRLTLLTLLIAASATVAAQTDKPNVLFIAIDDLRPELGCYGVDYIHSPRIDAFAKTARLFTHHYVTAPTCGASRYALLTGLSPRNNFEAGNHAFKQNLEFTAQRSIESFPHMFKEAGYETLSIGKICHGKQDTLPRSWSRILSPRRNHPKFQNNSGKKQRPAVRGLDLPDAAYQDGAMTDTVIETLRSLKDRPFFFAVGFVKPHLPFWAPKKYFDLYDPEKIPQADWSETPDSPSYHPSFELMQQYGHHPEAGLEDPSYRRHLKHGYAACVSFVDAQIGRILDEVEALGLDDNTIIVLWGDHGWHLGEHRIFGKHTSFERALKSVLIVRTPKMKSPGRPTDALVQSIDLYPTLAGLCGLTPPADIDGRPFLDMLDDPDLAGPEYALSYNQSYGAPFRGLPRLYAVTLRTRDYRYIQWQRDLGRGDILFQELYDHRSDPKEADNLAIKKPEVVKRLEELLAEHRDDNASSKVAGGIETDATGPRWQVSTTEDWQAFIADTNGIKIANGYAIAEKPQVSFTSQLKQFPEPIKLKDIELRQSVEWLNWQPCSLYQPNMKNAPVMISHGPNDHWIIAQHRSAEQLVEAYQAKVADAKKRNRKPPPTLTFSLKGFVPKEVTLEGYDEKLVTTPFANQYQPSEWKGDYSKPPLKRAWQSGYHAWHSRDMIHWVHYGPTAAAPTVTTAEYADGKTFFYYDRPNDRDPHLIIDHDLRDGLPGEDKGLAFDAPWGGSDVGVIRDLKGRFHMISENWQPINASKRSWDSPLASHMVSEDGIKDFKILKPAVDYRTKPTGKTATFEHPHWNDEEKVVTYEIHEPRQDAFGDWAAIAIGGQYYLVGDYDPANAEHGRNSMSVALFTSEDINTPFRFYGHIGSGHPDPDIMFADGKFYLITQTATDFVSEGPWGGTAQVRTGVDQDGDGKVDHWSKWHETRETYASIPGFAKQVDRTPAKVSFADLPAGKGFQIEVKLLSPEGHKSLPKLDQLIATFDSSQK